MVYQKSYTAMYIFLIATIVFSPETYGVSMKFSIIPLALMAFFGFLGRISTITFRWYYLWGLLWIALVVYSTLNSSVVEWTPNARSFCLLILFFILLAGKVPNAKNYRHVKTAYILLTLFCSCWIIIQSFLGLDRHEFMFLFWQKDVNYLAAFMLPGIYMMMRRFVFEETSHRSFYLLSVILSACSIVLLQSRAAFLTLAIMIALTFIQYLLREKISARKVFWVIFILLALGAVIVVLWSSPLFTRLTQAESYEDNVRLIIWEYAIQAYDRSPVWGSGLGASNYFSQLGAGHDTHCNYIDILGDTGIVGMILFLLIILRFLFVKKGFRLHMLTYLLICLIPMGFINGLQTISFWFPMLLLAHEHALIERRCLDDRNNHIASQC